MSCAISPPAYASYDILVHQLAVLRPASFRPPLAGWPLPFASSYRLITTRFSTVIFLQRTFTSLVHAHAGRTQVKAASPIGLDTLRAPLLEALLTGRSWHLPAEMGAPPGLSERPLTGAEETRSLDSHDGSYRRFAAIQWLSYPHT